MTHHIQIAQQRQSHSPDHPRSRRKIQCIICVEDGTTKQLHEVCSFNVGIQYLRFPLLCQTCTASISETGIGSLPSGSEPKDYSCRHWIIEECSLHSGKIVSIQWMISLTATLAYVVCMEWGVSGRRKIDSKQTC